VLGGTLADIDMLLEQPTLGETASVQVKWRATRPGVHLCSGDHFAEIAVKSGPFDWLMDRVG
jgi:hypothetical protein